MKSDVEHLEINTVNGIHSPVYQERVEVECCAIILRYDGGRNPCKDEHQKDGQQRRRRHCCGYSEPASKLLKVVFSLVLAGSLFCLNVKGDQRRISISKNLSWGEPMK